MNQFYPSVQLYSFKWRLSFTPYQTVKYVCGLVLDYNPVIDYFDDIFGFGIIKMISLQIK